MPTNEPHFNIPFTKKYDILLVDRERKYSILLAGSICSKVELTVNNRVETYHCLGSRVNNTIDRGSRAVFALEGISEMQENPAMTVKEIVKILGGVMKKKRRRKKCRTR